MNAPTTERLYNLLPAIYRQRDTPQGELLRALLAVIEGELQTLEADIDALYDNGFIETCAEWVVPYIGDLLGIRSLSNAQHLVFSQRARVANTIGYRRRKGIPAILEHAVHDATGWYARVVEFFELVGATQHVQHVRRGKGGTVDLRDRVALEQLGGPFDATAYRPDLRRIATNRGRHNTPNIGLFVWRLQSYPITLSALPGGGGRYYCDPFSYDVPLFNRPQTQTDLAQVATAINLPIPFTPQAFAADLQAYQVRYAHLPPEQRPAASDYYGLGRGLSIFKNGVPVPPFEVTSADLHDWERWDDTRLPQDKTVAVDVRVGRLAFAGPAAPERVEVAYSYGFSADIGGGPYGRMPTLAVPDTDTWFAVIAQSNAAGVEQPTGAPWRFTTLQQALEAWVNSGYKRGIIQILDSNVYPLRQEIAIPASGWLVLQAADGVRPSLRTDSMLQVHGQTADTVLVLNGLRCDGGIAVGGSLRLSLAHCTIPGGLQASTHFDNLHVKITHSILGPLRLPAAGVTGLTVQDSIVDGNGCAAIAADNDGAQPGPLSTLERTTVFGKVFVRELSLASEVIFTAPVTVERRQTGGMRFCYVPAGSATPQRYRCQPDLILTGVPALDEQVRVQRRLVPVFSTTQYRDADTHRLNPAYAQLSLHCAPEILSGAEDGAEMGVFHHLHQPQRAANLRTALDEYLPMGLEAGIFYTT